MDRHKILLILSKRIDGTAYTGRPTVEDMGVNHRCFHVMAIGLLGPAAIMSRAQGFPELIEEFRFRGSRGIGRGDATRIPGRNVILMCGNYFEWRSRPGHSFAPKPD